MSANEAARTSAPAEPEPRPSPRRGTRAARLAQLLERAGWHGDQISRNLPLGQLETPPGERRKHHHGARDDLAAYVLWAQPGVPAAVVATVASRHDPAAALPRAVRQAVRLDAAAAYATNGREILEHLAASRTTRDVADFPAPPRAWRAFARFHNLRGRSAELLGQRYDEAALANAAGVKGRAQEVAPRYYQLVASNRVLMALNRGEGRALLRMVSRATATAVAVVAKLVAHELSGRSGAAGNGFAAVYLDGRDSALTALGPLGATLRWGEVSASLRSLTNARDARSAADAVAQLDLASLDPSRVGLVVVNLAHGGESLDPTAWTAVLDQFPDAFALGVVATEPAAESVLEQRFGRPIYRYTRDHARVDGYLPRPEPADGDGPAPHGVDPALLSERLARSGLTDPDRVRDLMGGARGASAAGDPEAHAPQRGLTPVELRRLAQYRELARDQRAFAAELLRLYQLANYPGSLGRAARDRAAWLEELEAIAEARDATGAEQAVTMHIQLLRTILS